MCLELILASRWGLYGQGKGKAFRGKCLGPGVSVLTRPAAVIRTRRSLRGRSSQSLKTSRSTGRPSKESGPVEIFTLRNTEHSYRFRRKSPGLVQTTQS